ncbi:MAG: NUDIX hydrolase [Planctomycetota bacterium]
MSRQHGPWVITDSKECYRDPWVRLRRDEVIRPDGDPGTYCVVDLKPGVSVLAMDDAGKVFLTEEFHYGVGRVTLETVSGGIESDEDALESAKRELQEEIGITAELWTDLGTCDPFTANVVSPSKLYLAEGLTHGDASPEGTEQIRCVEMTLAEAFDAVMNSQITHSASSLAILKTYFLRGQPGSPPDMTG